MYPWREMYSTSNYSSTIFFWDPYYLNVVALDNVPEVSETILSSFHSFYFVVQCLRHLMGQPLYCSADAVMSGERRAGYGAGSTRYV